MELENNIQVDGMDIQRLEGFVEIEMTNTKDNLTRKFRNTITNVGKQYMLDKSAAQMLSTGADTYGMMVASGVLNKIGDNLNFPGRIADQDRDVTLAILNLGTKADSLSAETSYINVWDDNMVTRDKLVGYSNNNVTPAANGLEGQLVSSKGIHILDNSVITQRWKYDVGVGTGVVDTLAMMPAACVKTRYGDGIRISKCIDNVNHNDPLFVGMSTHYLPPGVPGYTANDEILLNYNTSGNSKWKFNMTTGETVAVPEGDPFFVPEEYTNVITDYLVDGNYLYLMSMNSVESTSTVINIAVYDITNSMNKVTVIQISSNRYIIGCKFLNINGEIRISMWGASVNATGSNFKMYKLVKGSQLYYNTYTTETDFVATGFIKPTGFGDMNHVGIGNYGSRYIMYVGVTEESKMTGYKSYGIVFTDLANPLGSAVEFIGGINPNTVPFSAGTNEGLIQIGYNYLGQVYTNSFTYSEYTIDSNKKIINNNGTKEIRTESTGVFISLGKASTNVMSFVKLHTPIVKGDDDIWHVTYGYKVK